MMTETQLTDSDFTEADEPLRLFESWLEDATLSEPNDPTATALATVDEDGLPNVRMVLLKGFDEKGFVFYTNFESIKGRELLASMKAAMCFHWKSLRRQVRVRGAVEQVTGATFGPLKALCEQAAEAADDTEANDRDWPGQWVFSVSPFLLMMLDLQRDRQIRTSSFCHVAMFRGSATPSQPAIPLNGSLEPDKPRGSAVGAGM
jgi:hypothetical protein